MDPTTSAAAISALAKAAAGFAGGPARSILGSRTRRFRVSWSAAREGKRRGILVSRRSIRKWLSRPDVQEQLRLGTSDAVGTATDNLAWLLAGETRNDREGQAQELLFVILVEFIRAHDPKDAEALSTSWLSQQVAAEGQATREAIDASSQTIIDRISAPQVFRDDLKQLHPWRQTAAEELVEYWPDAVPFIRTTVATPDRGALLKQWESGPPAQFTAAPAAALCLLGELAADYDEPAVAGRYIKKAIAAGAFPANYWWARAALVVGTIDPPEARKMLDEASSDPHPLGLGLAALHDRDYEAGAQILASWDASPGVDRALKATLLSACLSGHKDLNRAISVAVDGAELEPSATGLALQAASLLLSRARFGPSDHPLGDSGCALTLALRARNGRRSWNANSATAVLVAVQAAGMSGDSERAWRLTQTEPAGEATPYEAQDPRVKTEAAVIAAMTGRLEVANELANDLGDPYILAVVEGFTAISDDDHAAAAEAWMRAYNSAPDDHARLVTASSLAELGRDMPDLSDLSEPHPEQVAEIQSLHALLSAGAEKLPMLRARAHESARLTMSLADLYASQDNFMDAAQVLEEGATRFNEPHLMRMAAARYMRANDYSSAQRASESAITMGGSDWAGEFEVRIILFEAHESQGHLDETTKQARRLLSIEPSDVGVRWALIHCLARDGDADGAWSTLTPNGDPVEPRNQQEARTWIALMSRYDTSDQFVRRALAMMRRWPDDEQILGIFITQIYAGLRRDELSPAAADLDALHEATRDYIERFPDSHVFRSVPLGPEDDLLAPFADDLKLQFEALQDFDQQVQSGAMPLGVLVSATGRSYAEAAIRRAAGMVRSHLPNRGARIAAELPGLLNSPVAIDTTAAVTLALLDPAIQAALIGRFSRVHTTDAAFRDALTAQEFLGLRSTLSVHWDPNVGAPRPVSISEEVAEQLAEHSGRTFDILAAASRRAWPRLKGFGDISGDNWEWLATLDMALELRMPFWCDDYVLASVAVEKSLPTFGTVDLLRHLSTSGAMDAKLVETAEALLIRNYHVELGFQADVMALAAAGDGWEPRGAAFALTRSATWSDAEPVMDFLNPALVAQLERSPDDLSRWISCSAVGLVRDIDAAAASSNLQVLLGRLLRMPWMRPDRFPAAINGVRQGTIERPELLDPLEPVLRHMHTRLVERHGHATAAPLLLSLVQHGSEEDRGTAARIILSAE